MFGCIAEFGQTFFKRKIGFCVRLLCSSVMKSPFGLIIGIHEAPFLPRREFFFVPRVKAVEISWEIKKYQIQFDKIRFLLIIHMVSLGGGPHPSSTRPGAD